jgi:Uncharacterised nucleotidyltransferase
MRVTLLAMPSSPSENFHGLLASMKRAAAVLRDAGIEFMLGGGIAIWARGGPTTDHDVDLYVRRRDADRALEALVQDGFRAERPPEDWLYKALDEKGNLVDLIFSPAGGEVDDATFERASEIEVSALSVLVASADDVLVTKLLAINEQEPDYRAILEVARALREQVDWEVVRERTSESPFARAFFTLAEGLGIIGETLAPSAARVR